MKRHIIVAVGRLIEAVLTVALDEKLLHKETKPHGAWKEATPEEAEELKEVVADMVAEYSSNVN